MWNVLWLEMQYLKVLLCRPFGNELRGPLARESITGVDIGLDLFTYWVLHPGLLEWIPRSPEPWTVPAADPLPWFTPFLFRLLRAG